MDGFRNRLGAMPSHDNVHALTRALALMLVDTMVELSAVKVLLKVHTGPQAEEWKAAIESARERIRPSLDSLKRASDQDLLDALGQWRGPLQ